MSKKEEIILEDKAGMGIFSGKLILTKSKLSFYRLQGIFRAKYELEKEIPLEEIEKCYANTGHFLKGTIQIVLKNGDETNFGFRKPASTILSTLDGRVGSEVIFCEKWVHAINHARGKNKDLDEPLKLLKLRFAKGEITKEQYEEMKKVLEEK